MIILPLFFSNDTPFLICRQSMRFFVKIDGQKGLLYTENILE
jgi:hypothetical protein